MDLKKTNWEVENEWCLGKYVMHMKNDLGILKRL